MVVSLVMVVVHDTISPAPFHRYDTILNVNLTIWSKRPLLFILRCRTPRSFFRKFWYSQTVGLISKIQKWIVQSQISETGNFQNQGLTDSTAANPWSCPYPCSQNFKSVSFIIAWRSKVGSEGTKMTATELCVFYVYCIGEWTYKKL